MKDPRGGSIASDAFLVIVQNVDGTPQAPVIEQQFVCLQSTGDFCQSGDMNMNGSMDLEDAQMFVDVLMGVDEAPTHVAIADVNHDGVADGRDVAPMVELLMSN